MFILLKFCVPHYYLVGFRKFIVEYVNVLSGSFCPSQIQLYLLFTVLLDNSMLVSVAQFHLPQ